MTERSMRPLAATLESLGIEELKERLEVSPLLVGTGGDGTESPDMDNCCTCKILPSPNDDMGE